MGPTTENNFHSSTAYQLHALVAVMDKLADQFLTDELNITYSQFLILITMDELEHPSQQDLAKCLGVTPAAVSRQIESLCDLELIERKQQTTSRRTYVLKLRAKGRTIAAKSRELLSKRFDELMAQVPPADQEAFNRTLQYLLATISTRKNYGA